MHDDKARQRKRRTGLRKLSRRQTEARIAEGALDPELDFVCPSCNGVYSRYQGRYKIHIRACERRTAKSVLAPPEHPLPAPPPFEVDIFPPAATMGE